MNSQDVTDDQLVAMIANHLTKLQELLDQGEARGIKVSMNVNNYRQFLIKKDMVLVDHWALLRR